MTWMEHLRHLLPNDTYITNWHNDIPKYFKFQTPKHISLEKYFKRENYMVFSFVRHPFDRLVSAYLDKIISSESKYHERAKIRQKYHIKQITFQHFLNHVVGQFKKFKKFKHIKSIDEHWRPFYLRCPYCFLDYDHFIGKMEIFSRDVR